MQWHIYKTIYKTACARYSDVVWGVRALESRPWSLNIEEESNSNSSTAASQQWGRPGEYRNNFVYIRRRSKENWDSELLHSSFI